MPKSPSSFYLACDVLGCESRENIWPGEEERLTTHRGWAIVYPIQPNSELDCRVFCPKHAHMAAFIDRTVTFYVQKHLPFIDQKWGEQDDHT